MHLLIDMKTNLFRQSCPVAGLPGDAAVVVQVCMCEMKHVCVYVCVCMCGRGTTDKTDSSFSQSHSSSMTSLDNVNKEAIQCLTFADAYARKAGPTTLTTYRVIRCWTQHAVSSDRHRQGRIQGWWTGGARSRRRRRRGGGFWGWDVPLPNGEGSGEGLSRNFLEFLSQNGAFLCILQSVAVILGSENAWRRGSVGFLS